MFAILDNITTIRQSLEESADCRAFFQVPGPKGRNKRRDEYLENNEGNEARGSTYARSVRASTISRLVAAELVGAGAAEAVTVSGVGGSKKFFILLTTLIPVSTPPITLAAVPRFLLAERAS